MKQKQTILSFILGILVVIFLGLGTCIVIDEFLLPKPVVNQEDPIPEVKEYILDNSKSEQVFTLTSLPEKEELGYIKLGASEYLVTYKTGTTNGSSYPVLKIGSVSIGGFDSQSLSIYLLPKTILVQNVSACEKSLLTFLNYDLEIINEKLVNQMFIKWDEGFIGYYNVFGNNDEGTNIFAEYNIPFNFTANTTGTEVFIKEVPNYSLPCTQPE